MSFLINISKAPGQSWKLANRVTIPVLELAVENSTDKVAVRRELFQASDIGGINLARLAETNPSLAIDIGLSLAAVARIVTSLGFVLPDNPAVFDELTTPFAMQHFARLADLMERFLTSE